MPILPFGNSSAKSLFSRVELPLATQTSESKRIVAIRWMCNIVQFWSASDKVCKQTVGDGAKGVASRAGVQEMVHWRSYQEHQGQRP